MTSHAKTISTTPIEATSPRQSFAAANRPDVETKSREREQRRATFIRERTDPESGGRVRILNKTFNR